MDSAARQHRDPFPSTVWSQVRKAAAGNEPGSGEALEQIFRSYERPVLAFIQSHGYPSHDSEDLKQSFFHHLLRKASLADAVQAGVKLRAFMLTKLKSFLIDQHRRGAAQKRGSGQIANWTDLDEARTHLIQPVDDVTPVIVYQRQWVESLAANAMKRLRADYAVKKQEETFDAIAPFITRDPEERLAEISVRLKRSVPALKSEISRLRARCQEEIRRRIADTLDNPTPQDIEAELTELMGYRA